MNSSSCDILIVGGGPAGMSAALAAAERTDAHVTVVDDNPRLGGQIWRSELGIIKSPVAAKIIEAIESRRIQIINDTQIFASTANGGLIAENPAGTLEFSFEKLIIATGARERFLPFPDWTMPNVLGAGGLQALVKGGLNIKNKRILIAGSGPLLLAVAEYLKTKGADILLIAEQASAANINKFLFGLWRHPSKIAQAAALRLRLRGTPYLTDCWVTSCKSKTQDESKSEHAGTSVNVSLTRNNKVWAVECDYLACGFHLVPNIELASLMGCEINDGFVSVNDFQTTSCENIYCAGEPTGIGGVEAALLEGKIAGYAAVGKTDKAAQIFAAKNKTAHFAERLNEAFAIRDELKTLADAGTIVCRCEDVEYGRLTQFSNWRDAKLQTRCGMGPCQGRICGVAAGTLFNWETGSVRPPIFPVKLENL